MTVHTAGDALKVRAPGSPSSPATPLARLKDGRSVRVELAALMLAAAGKSPAPTARQIFPLSYDLWEERFAVTPWMRRSQSISHLTPAAAEAWCVEQLAIPLSALGTLGRDLPFWVRLEAPHPRRRRPRRTEGLGFTLQALIDALSRRRKSEPSTHALEAGPFRLPPLRVRRP